jgi:hypothetical protein
MPVSKHRKAHKKKSQQRTSGISANRAKTMGLIRELQDQLEIVRANPVSGVDIQNSDMLTITGSLPAYEINTTNI